MTTRDSDPPPLPPPPAMELVRTNGKRRVHTVRPPTFSSTPDNREIALAIANIAMTINHNSAALMEEFDDVRQEIQDLGRAVRALQERTESFEQRVLSALHALSVAPGR